MATVTKWAHEPPAIVLLPGVYYITLVTSPCRWSKPRSRGRVAACKTRPLHNRCTVRDTANITTSLQQQLLSVYQLENTQFSVGIFRRPFLKRYHRSLILWSPPGVYKVRPSRPLLEIRDQLRTSLWGDVDAQWLPSNFFPTGQIGRFPKTCVVSVAINTGRVWLWFRELRGKLKP